jgi:hypothetical protein
MSHRGLQGRGRVAFERGGSLVNGRAAVKRDARVADCPYTRRPFSFLRL